MASVAASKAPVSTNPLKVSAPLGAAMAYLGVEGAVPLFHGSQGCTAFALVHLVRHFKESIDPERAGAVAAIEAELRAGYAAISEKTEKGDRVMTPSRIWVFTRLEE